MKLWRVAGVLALIGAEALLYGYSYPFFSLALDKHELPTWLIGLNASVAGAGILIVGPVLPALIARFGVRLIVAAMFAISLASFGAILAADHMVVWFAARFVMGACFAALWTTTEIWLNGVVDDRHRGRIIGASGTLYATCQFIGPLVLGGVGVEGQLPLIVAMIPLGVGVLVALSIRPAEGEVEDEEENGDAHTLRLALTAAGGLVAAAFLGGIGETAMQSLLPLYGLAHGFSDAGAAGLVAVFSLGEAVLVAGLGWMADRYGRRLTLLACASVAGLSAVSIPFAVGIPFLLQPALFIAGGTIAGIYTLGVVLIGQDFRGQRLAVVSTGFAMAYSAGSIVGSTPVGYIIDVFGPEALPFSIAAGFALLTLFLLRPEKSEDEAERIEPALEAGNEFDSLPVIEETAGAGFDLAFLHQVAPLPAGEPAAATPPLADIREWHETNLEDRFRQRAVELAERAAKRYATATHHNR